MSTVQERLAGQRTALDKLALKGFIGVTAMIDPYGKRCVVVKTKEKEHTAYSFSVDQVYGYDFLESRGIPVFIQLEDGSLKRWRGFRYRLADRPTDYQKITF